MSQSRTQVSRRTLFAGAATAGVVAAAATLVPKLAQESDTPEPAKEPPARGGGYQLSDHVKQYYKSART